MRRILVQMVVFSFVFGAWAQKPAKPKKTTVTPTPVSAPVKAAVKTYATTDTGERVVLRIDGTWEIITTESAVAEISPTPPEAVATAGEFDFRKSEWGWSRKQVKASESSKPVKDDTTLLGYEATVGGLSCYVIYIFASEQLVRAKYVFKEEHTSENSYISDFDSIKGTLIEKYGTPKSQDKFWTNDLYKSKPSQWGFAVSLGHLSYFTTWKNEQVTITQVLTGDNYKISHLIEYKSVKLSTLEDQEKAKKTLSDF